ncbi:MAG TPA: M48 family metallopeptidase [Marmoricola sp.]|nr:M48 family metallopeptidase [Marmoricola sp.]
MSTTSLDRRAAWAVVAGSALTLAVLGGVLVPWDWVPGGTLHPPAAREVFTPEQLARSESYAASVRPLSWASLAVSTGLALVLGLTRAGAALVARLPRRWWVAVPTAVLLLLALGRVATLPFGLLVRQRRLEAGLTEQGLAGWLADRGLGLLVSWVVMTLLLLLVVGAARRSPRRWFVWAGSGVAVATFAGSLLYPVVVEPLFNDFTPMAQGELRSSLLALADEEGVEVEDVLVADASRRTTTLNAYVSGLGGTRRIVVYDTLLAAATPGEVRSVVAHEIAHARHQDVLLGTTLAAVGAVLGTSVLALLLSSARLRRRAGVAGAADPRVVPLVLALVAVGTLASAPVQNAVSRAVEARADRAALAATDDGASFAALQKRLALRSLADPTPPRWSQLWFGSHPTVLERLGLLASVEAAQEERSR